MKTKALTVGGIFGAAITAALGLVACGEASSDCHENRTCPEVQGQGADSGIGSDDMRPDGGDATGGMGAEREPGTECTVARDCTNDDAADGEEGCDNGYCVAGNAPPTIISVSPGDKAVDVEPDSEIVIELSEPLAADTVTSESIQVLDGADPVPGELNYADNKVVFKPQVPLSLLVNYSIAVSVDVTDVDGVPLLEAFGSTFDVRDGQWSVTTALPTKVSLPPLDLPVDDAGNVLLTWDSLVGGSTCPPMAQWFRRGVGLDSAKPLTGAGFQQCGGIHAATATGNDVLVNWFEDAETATFWFKDGEWAAKKRPITTGTYASWSALSVAPDGVIHYIESRNLPQVGLFAYVSNAAGVWSSGPYTITDEKINENPELRVGKNGKAVAVWNGTDATNHRKIGFSTYLPDKHAWAKGGTIPGSLILETNTVIERGNPRLALNDNGDAMVLWIDEKGEIMASRSQPDSSAWADPVGISGTIGTRAHYVQPSLIFDGTTFVAAWTKPAGNTHDVYVARYDATDETWGAYQRVNDAKTPSTPRMPELRADAHQNLILVWAVPTSTPNVFDVAYQRYNARSGTWGRAQVVNDARPNYARLAGDTAVLTLGMGSHGQAALAWGDLADPADHFLNVRLASFD
jgi:hypothetical protein